MKTRIATAISVVGILGAGSAAALVNTQILDGGSAETSASAAVVPPASTVDLSVPDAPEPTLPETTVDTTIATTSSSEPPASTTTQPPAPTTTQPPAPAQQPASTGFLTSFNVGDAGVVTVDVIDGQLILIKAEAKPGWDIVKTEEHVDENEIEVEFRSTTLEVEFEATFIDGRIVPHVSSKSIAAETTAAATVPSNTVAGDSTGHDDDGHESDHDDDGHDNDGHESDHDGDDDHDDDHDDDDRDDD